MGEKTDRSDIEIKRNIRIKKVYPDGNADVELVCEYMITKYLDPNGAVMNTVDSREKSSESQLLASLVAQPLVIKMTPTGNILSVSGAQEAMDNFYNTAESQKLEQSEKVILGHIVNTLFGEQNIRDLAARFLFIPYPDHPVAINDSWENEHQITNDYINLTVALRFQLKEIQPQKNKVVLSFEELLRDSASTSDMLSIKIDKSYSSGTYEINSVTGYISKLDFTTDTDINTYKKTGPDEEWQMHRKSTLRQSAYLVKSGEPLPESLRLSEVPVSPKVEEAPKTIDDYGQQLERAMKRNDLKKADEILDTILTKFDVKTLDEPRKYGLQFIQSVVYTKLGKYAEAEKIFLEYLPFMEKKLGSNAPELVVAKSNLGEVYIKQQKWDQAEALMQGMLLKLEHGNNPRSLSMVLNNLGYLYKQKQQYDKAESFYKRAIQVDMEIEGEASLSAAASYGNLCQVELLGKKLSEAEKHCKQASLIYEKQLAADHPNVGIAWKDLGIVYANQGKKQEALAAWEKGSQILDKAYQFMKEYYGPLNPDVLMVEKALNDLKTEKSKLKP
jgi:tetratricopeptide (TPR) repeat protein